MIKKHPYITATLVATLLAIVVWLCVPKEYTAVTKLSDEYKEVDLAVGLNAYNIYIRNMMGSNNGMNDMATYSKVLKTESFARTIANKKLQGKGMTYGEYLHEEDTIEIVSSHINYNYSARYETLLINFTDRDPVVAAQMLDSVTVSLQQFVTECRQNTADALFQNAKKELANVEKQYKQVQKKYSDYVDTHLATTTRQSEIQEKALEKEVKAAYALYTKQVNEYVRQKALKQRSYLSFSVIQGNKVPQHPNCYFISYLLSFIVIALLLTYGVNLWLKRRKEKALTLEWGGLFSPWAITFIVWAMILGAYYILDTDLYPLSSQFYNTLVLWLLIFCPCAFLAYNLSSKSTHNSIQTFDFHKSIFNFFFAISLVITPLYVYRVMQVVMMFDTVNMMNNMRLLAIYGESPGLLGYSNIINQSLFVVSLWAYPKVPKWQVVLLAIACLLNSLAIMEKGTMFFVFICIFFVLFKKKVIKLQSFALAGVVLITFFYFFNLARSEEGSDYQKNETLLDFFAMYVISPPVAFGRLLPEAITQMGTNTFETVYLFLDRFGVQDIVVKEKLQEFDQVPVFTNVYTIFQPFFIDFGYRGIAFFAMLYGTVSGFLYRLFMSGNSTGRCPYTYMVEVLILQFYQENIFLSIVLVIQFVFFVTLITQHKISFQYVTLKPYVSR